MGKLFESNCYCTNLRRSARTIGDFYTDALRAHGINAAQYYLLVCLENLGQANSTHWAEFVGLERSTMVRNIRVLLEHGWIEETSMGRVKQYTLNDRSRELLSRAGPIWIGLQKKIEEFLGAEDAAAILRIGEKLQSLGETF